MVRPKGSERNLKVALAFADMVTMKVAVPDGGKGVLVPRKGPRSIYNAFCICVPDLVREMHETRPRNRRAVSHLEMNKALAASGLKCIRKRDRSNGETRWCAKVN